MFSQWRQRFIDRVFFRPWRGRLNTLKMKALHYNLYESYTKNWIEDQSDLSTISVATKPLCWGEAC